MTRQRATTCPTPPPVAPCPTATTSWCRRVVCVWRCGTGRACCTCCVVCSAWCLTRAKRRGGRAETPAGARVLSRRRGSFCVRFAGVSCRRSASLTLLPPRAQDGVAWDSVHYLRIAQCGYETERSHAFFPALPAAMRALQATGATRTHAHARWRFADTPPARLFPFRAPQHCSRCFRRCTRAARLRSQGSLCQTQPSCSLRLPSTGAPPARCDACCALPCACVWRPAC